MSLPVTPTAHTHHNTNSTTNKAPQAAWQAQVVAASSIVAAVVRVMAHRSPQ